MFGNFNLPESFQGLEEYLGRENDDEEEAVQQEDVDEGKDFQEVKEANNTKVHGDFAEH